jgi:glycosyltransferase involved in cell wall biosynthesis
VDQTKERLRVVHVITSLQQGGAQMVLVRLVGALKSHCQHTVVCLREDDVCSGLLRAEGAEVICLEMPPGRMTYRGISTLAEALRRVRPQVVQTWMYHADLLGGLASRFAGIHAIAWGIRNSDLDPRRTKWSTRMVVRICSMLSSWVPKVIVSCSQRARDIHVALGYQQDKFIIVPNGYDLTSFRPRPDARKNLRAELGVADEVPLVGMVARWDPQKDHATFLEAAKRVLALRPAARFVLVGSEMTYDNPRLAALIDAQGMRDRMLLLGSRTDIPEVMSALDVHVLSSAYGEAFPNVVAESMACGTPCVVTDVGDAAYIVGKANRVVPPGDNAQLAHAIDGVLAEMSSNRNALARDCQERIRSHFSISNMTDRYLAAWQQLAPQHDA